MKTFFLKFATLYLAYLPLIGTLNSLYISVWQWFVPHGNGACTICNNQFMTSEETASTVDQIPAACPNFFVTKLTFLSTWYYG